MGIANEELGESALQRASAMEAHVGQRLRQRRMQLRMSQEDLAIALGTTRLQVYKYETGDNRLSSGRLYELSLLLDVPVVWFFEGDSEADPARDQFVSKPAMVSDEEIVGELERSVRRYRNSLLKLQLLQFARLLAKIDEPQEAPCPPAG